MSEKDIMMEPLDDEDLESVAGGAEETSCGDGCGDGGVSSTADLSAR